ncbi:MAG: ABC transporter ATP-binding protein [Burkholderiaceae bacterium]
MIQTAQPIHIDLDHQGAPTRLQVSLTIRPGDLTVVLGPSGSGKTSLLRALCGLFRPDRGFIRHGDQYWFSHERGIHQPPQARSVGVVFQNYGIMPHLTALQNVCLHGAPNVIGLNWLDRVGLSAQAQQLASTLSGGQQQRVAIARALAQSPHLLLLDEPFSAVDQSTRTSLYELIAEIRMTSQIPMLMVTHNLEEARLLADQLLVMDEGVGLQQGDPRSITLKPRNARVADIVGIQNRYKGLFMKTSVDGVAELRWGLHGDNPHLQIADKGRIPDQREVDWVVPAEAIRLGDYPRSCGIRGRVGQIRQLGETVLCSVHLDYALPQTLHLTLSQRESRALQLEAGSEIELGLDCTMIHVMPVKKSMGAAVE